MKFAYDLAWQITEKDNVHEGTLTLPDGARHTILLNVLHGVRTYFLVLPEGKFQFDSLNKLMTEGLGQKAEVESDRRFPRSLANDPTKQGLQSTIVHQSGNNLILSLINGVLTLKPEGTWEWSER